MSQSESFIERGVIRAVREVNDIEGLTTSEIELYCTYRGLLDPVPDRHVMELSVKRALKNGLLTKLESGRYILKKTANRRKSRSKSKSKKKSINKTRSSSGRRSNRLSSRSRRRSSNRSSTRRSRKPSKSRRRSKRSVSRRR